jgi:hypothetical protein
MLWWLLTMVASRLYMQADTGEGARPWSCRQKSKEKLDLGAAIASQGLKPKSLFALNSTPEGVPLHLISARLAGGLPAH